jgi:hypothetical protein
MKPTARSIDDPPFGVGWKLRDGAYLIAAFFRSRQLANDCFKDGANDQLCR